jgi:hypothetical protein
LRLIGDAAWIASKRRALGCIALLVLAGCTLGLDFVHGTRLGEDRVVYAPPYRLRQSLAVAISRERDPPLGGYLAYRSVVDVFSMNGFALRDGDPGPKPDAPSLNALINDGPRIDRIIQQAREVRIDPGLPPEIIQANELGLADYIYLSFRLFGPRIASLYDFLFVIVGGSCLLYALQFRRSPFLLLLLVLFVAALYFLENYAHSNSYQQNTVSNSRLFSGLSLLPAVHILAVLWQRRSPHALTVAAVAGQSLIFAFLLSCRTEVAWQAAMIVAIAAGLGLALLRAPRGPAPQGRLRRLEVLWPAAVFLLVLSGYSAAVSFNADARYAAEPEAHILWHEVLMGILGTNPDLRREYVGADAPVYADTNVYRAVIHDLNVRDDRRSPIVITDNGQLSIAPTISWKEYDRLVRSLTLRIILHHPWAMIASLSAKVRDQVVWFDLPGTHTMAWSKVRVPVALIATGALLCMAAGGFTADRGTLRGVAAIIATVLLFAAITPLLRPSGVAIGTLFSYLGAMVIAVAYGVALAVGMLTGTKPWAKGVSSPAEPVR